MIYIYTINKGLGFSITSSKEEAEKGVYIEIENEDVLKTNKPVLNKDLNEIELIDFSFKKIISEKIAEVMLLKESAKKITINGESFPWIKEESQINFWTRVKIGIEKGEATQKFYSKEYPTELAFNLISAVIDYNKKLDTIASDLIYGNESQNKKGLKQCTSIEELKEINIDIFPAKLEL